MILHLYKKGYKVKKISLPGYFYRKGHVSTLGSCFNEKDWDLFFICEEIENDFKEEKELQPFIYQILAGNMMYQFLYKTNLLTKGRIRHKRKIREYSKKMGSISWKRRLILLNLDVVWLANYVRNKIRRKTYA